MATKTKAEQRMQSITEIIRPIELKAGPHDDTAQTGSGCFMNVIAYLNGEDQITDRSPCVHPVIRAFMIKLNDYFVPLGYGPRLIPFIQRAMGTNDMNGQNIAMQLANMAQCEIAPLVSDNGDVTLFAEGSVSNAIFAGCAPDAADAAADAAISAVYGADDIAVLGVKIFNIIEQRLDRILPPADAPSQAIIDAAKRLVAIKESA